jgi:murein L,D-transpeptidase YafK
MAAGFLLGLISVAHAAAIPTSPRLRPIRARVEPTLEAATKQKGLTYGAPIFIRIFKESRQLEVWMQAQDRFTLFRTYEICAFSGGLGPKVQMGDFKSPEGFYAVTPRQMNPRSRYHLSFDLGYPNAYDRTHSRTGNALMVHGDCVSAGCYAMTNAKIEEIYMLADAALRHGQPFFRVHVFPFRMTTERMGGYQDSEWFPFWQNLKEGYDFFEHKGWPPNVSVRHKRYFFE